jgi:membrane associated rhomboid family serine protease
MFDRITPMVKNLLIINIAVHVFAGLYSTDFIHQYFAFFNPLLPNSPELLNPLFKPWQFGNMFGLFIFGSALETFMGSKKFLIYYLVCGIGAAFLNSALDYYEMSNISVDSLEYLRQAQIPMVGASGAIFGILMAFGFLFPNVEMMLLFFPFPIKAKYFVAMYGVYELIQGTAGLQSGIAHFAHLGGLLTGFILLKFFGFSKRNYY